MQVFLAIARINLSIKTEIQISELFMRFITPLAVSAFILLSSQSLYAQPQDDGGHGGPMRGHHDGPFEGGGERGDRFKDLKGRWQNMSKEEKLATIETRRAERLKKREEKFSTMTDQEKLALINERFKKMHDKMDSKWKGMSDDEKIEFVEKRMSEKGRHRRGERGQRPEGQDRGGDTLEQP